MAKRYADAAAAWEQQVKQRTGITRHQPQAIVHGMPMARLIGSPVTLRDRWLRTKGREHNRGYYVALLLLTFQTADGQTWTVMQARTVDLNRKYTIKLSGFFNLRKVAHVS